MMNNRVFGAWWIATAITSTAVAGLSSNNGSGGDQYIHRETSDRQERLHWCFKDTSVQALHQSGVVESANVLNDFQILEIGSGAGHTTMDLLAKTLPDTTKIVAVDADASMIEAAKHRQRNQPTNTDRITFLHTTGEALAKDMPGQFDAIWIRFVLIHVPDPIGLLQAAVDCLKPGGILLVEDTCTSGSNGVCDPPNFAHAFFHAKHAQATRQLGGDLMRGSKVGGYMNKLGLRDMQCHSFTPIFAKGDTVQPWTAANMRESDDNKRFSSSESQFQWGVQLFQQSFDSLLPKLQEMGLCTDDEAEKAKGSMAEFVASSRTEEFQLFCLPDGTQFQWWAVKP